jgi:eukaryotic-like serine/threonine-protein kinase
MSSSLKQGAIFAGRYRVLRRIATGGMGAVYEVIHLETARHRALKIMLPGVLDNPEIRERFIREAKVGAQVDSDFVVDVVDAGTDEETESPFLVMELLRGEDLGRRLERLGRLEPTDVVTYLYHAALALDVMHRASVIHRDVKPDNLFLTEREDGPPRIKVLDFGVAKVVAESGAADVTQRVGTPLYMAPEQYDSRAKITGAADVYALGMVAYALLVGSPYWAEEASSGRLFALAAVTMRGPKEPASKRAAAHSVTLPPAFDAWFSQITALDPPGRFASATEAVRALSDALGLAPPSRPIPSSPFGWSAVAPEGRAGLGSLPTVLSMSIAPASAAPPSTTASVRETGAVVPTLSSAPRRSLTPIFGAGVAVLAGVVLSARLYGAPVMRSPAGHPGSAPPGPPPVAAPPTAAPAGVAPPAASSAARPEASAEVAPARRATVRVPRVAPLYSRD